MTVLLISFYIVCRAIHTCTAAFIVHNGNRPVVRAMYTNIVLHTHTAVVTHIYTYIYAYYTTTVNRARMYMSPNKKYTGFWYSNQHKQQYCTSTYICTYHGYS